MLNVPSIEIYSSQKILEVKAAAGKIAQLKATKDVGLCHGGVDLVHPGHVKHFESAKRLCDVLFVSVTSDEFVEKRKGTGRPVYTDKLRAYAIAALDAVDFVVISNTEKGTDIIQQLKPSLYIKGPDYIGKLTPGIIAEREAIAAAGGKMVYTTEEHLSTTKIIEYIKKEVKDNTLLLVVDRDGTLITNNDFPGKDNNWKEKIELNGAVVDYIIALQTKFKTTKIVVSNQSGVARKYFDCSRVEEVNKHIASLLKTKNISIDNWQYCPDVDAEYAQKKGMAQFHEEFVKQKTARKPATDMVQKALQELKKSAKDFENIVVLGNSEDDKKLAENISARYIDVNGKKYKELLSEFG